MRDGLKGRMAEQISTEEVTRFNPVYFQKTRQVIAGKARSLPYSNDETEPGRI